MRRASPRASQPAREQSIELALASGLTDLVGNHLATYTYGGEPSYKCGVHTFRPDGDACAYELHNARTPEAQAWLARFLPALREHLRDRGWLGRWWQNVRDEPFGIREDYEAIYDTLKRIAPEFRTIDALHGPIVKACDCWVPLIDAWGENLEFFHERQRAGDKVWTYVCCGPTGAYPNRFIDQKSVLPRLIFWHMARGGAQGYLHWGYNWSDMPVPEIDATGFLPVQGPVQSGDVCVVYPGPNGPHDSIRWEMQREGIQDHELLRLLEQHSPAKAHAIVDALCADLERNRTEPALFRRARRALLAALDEPGKPLRLSGLPEWPRIVPVTSWQCSRPMPRPKRGLPAARCVGLNRDAGWRRIDAGSHPRGFLSIRNAVGERDAVVYLPGCSTWNSRADGRCGWATTAACVSSWTAGPCSASRCW